MVISSGKNSILFVTSMIYPISMFLHHEMNNFPTIFLKNLPRNIGGIFLSALNFIVFLFLDLLDFLLCIFYRVVDEFFDDASSSCYCKENIKAGDELSESLYGRKNIFREISFPGKSLRKLGGEKKRNAIRWSDCRCQNCSSWISNVDHKLHFVVNEQSISQAKDTENVIFLHGFLESSSFWTKTVFSNFSDSTKQNYRLFAVDLLGFGQSPKPNECLYTLKDHVEMIENSVVIPFGLNSFHLVAHSMGCIIALALAAKYPNSVKSITLIAPPYFPCEENASLKALKIVAKKSLWPPLLFGSSLMSWYEHVGRCVCFLVCRHHRIWEWILKKLTRSRDLHFMIIDLTRHTHHSAWHTMHNVICGGAKVTDSNLEILSNSGVKISVIQGFDDQVVPLECSKNVKIKAPNAEISFIKNANHSSVILGREKDFATDLELIWASVC